jgi:hypothetical protein
VAVAVLLALVGDVPAQAADAALLTSSAKTGATR